MKVYGMMNEAVVMVEEIVKNFQRLEFCFKVEMVLGFASVTILMN